jgi:hypothetical protein
MARELVNLGWKWPAETAAERLILVHICYEANSFGQSIYFSMKTYAKVGLLKSTRGAQKIIRRLEEKQILLDDPDFEVYLRKNGKKVRARVYRLNIEKMKADIEAARDTEVVIDAWEVVDAETELSSPMEGPVEGELSSPSESEAGVNSVPVKGELSSPNTYLDSTNINNPHSPPSADYSADFEKLWGAWTPFEMNHGDKPQAERKYAKIRGEGVSAEQVLTAARVYCQQCRTIRCKTKHLENWLGQCVWKPEQKGLGGNANGKSGAKKPPSTQTARVYVAIDSDGVEQRRWWPHEAPNQWIIDREYPGCRLRIRDARPEEIAELQMATGENNGENKITAQIDAR